MATLNLGAGLQEYGDVRVDRLRTASTTVRADPERGLPFKDGIFDEVYSRSFFEHLKNPFSTLLEMRRVCKPGGRIVIITDNAGYPTHYIPRFYGDHVGTYSRTARDTEDRHYEIYTREHLANFARVAGLEILELTLVPGEHGTSFLTRLLRRIPLLSELAYPWIRMVVRNP